MECSPASLLGPILFSINTLSLSMVLDKHNLCHHFYVDDTQIYMLFRPKCTILMMNLKAGCISYVRIWMASNSLDLNDSLNS